MRDASTIRRETTTGVGLAKRVVAHLHGLGRFGLDDVAPIGATQKGMTTVLQVRQGTLVRVLQGLESAGVLTVERRHVSGVNNRLKVYQLTPRGESIARDVRRAEFGLVKSYDRGKGPSPERTDSPGSKSIKRD
jgi:DNA-binding MarR family transcriptional regulator